MAELNVERIPRRSIGPWLLAIIALAVVIWAIEWNPSESANPVIATGTPAGLPPRSGTTADVPLVRSGDVDPVGTVALVPAANVRGAPAEVNGYLGYITRRRGAPTTTVAPDETADALRRLATAVQSVAGAQATALRPAVDSLRRAATALQNQRDSLLQAPLARDAFLLGAGMLRQVQERRAPAGGGLSDALTHAAEAVDPARPLSVQGRAVQRYLDTAGAVLERIARGR